MAAPESLKPQLAKGQSVAARRGRKRRALLWVVAVFALLIAGAFAGLEIWRRFNVPADAPVVGVTYDRAWHARARLSTKNYEIALTRIGARVVVLEPGEASAEDCLDRIDALLLTGGGDVDPDLYDGGDPESARLVDRERDLFEIELIRGALKRDMPILGICRGIQILNVAQGGTLKSLREDEALAARHGIELDSMSAHSVDVEAGSRLAGILGSGKRDANSFHGQAVDRIGEGLVVAARAEDGVVEALEHPGKAFVVTTQWHPEVPPPQLEVFRALLEAARNYRKTVE